MEVVQEPEPEPVILHIYDLGKTGRFLNRILRPLDLGMFHCGVEVYNWEWSYSETPDASTGSGVFSCQPGHCGNYSHVGIVSMGKTRSSESDVRRFIVNLTARWASTDY